jgi:DNA-binding transcriptional regulator YhcF (GntR family)
MLLRPLDASSDRPLHEQVAASVRRAIVDSCEPGDRLPTAADVASVLGVNTNTALRALRALRDEGVVEFRRGRGVTVATRGDRRGRIGELIDELISEAHKSGYTVDEVIEMIQEQR